MSLCLEDARRRALMFPGIIFSKTCPKKRFRTGSPLVRKGPKAQFFFPNLPESCKTMGFNNEKENNESAKDDKAQML